MAVRDINGASPIIELEQVNKWYGQFHVLTDINLQVRQGEKIVICGPSGSGKSTLIRCINRLEEHQEGTIAVQSVREGEQEGEPGTVVTLRLPAAMPHVTLEAAQ